MKPATYKKLGSLVLALTMVGAAAAQQPLTNEGIIKMDKSGMGEDIIVTVIERQPGTFSITADDLIRLTQAGATDKVLAAMLRKAGAPAAAPVPSLIGPKDVVSARLGQTLSGQAHDSFWREVSPVVTRTFKPHTQEQESCYEPGYPSTNTY